MHLNSVKQICLDRPLIPFSSSFNAINRNKSSANRKKLADNNKGANQKTKLVPKKNLANNNGRNSNKKLSVEIKSLIREKNINEDGNASIQKQEKGKVKSVLIERAVLSNFL